jgi:hypothetical protein
MSAGLPGLSSLSEGNLRAAVMLIGLTRAGVRRVICVIREIADMMCIELAPEWQVVQYQMHDGNPFLIY